MQTNFTTKGLQLAPLNPSEAKFIFELLNTPEWKKFIGDRNIETIADAGEYIKKISDNPNVHYWVVKLTNTPISIGIITFIKRDYLEHSDIGFAFLPRFSHQGYAYEATTAVLNELIKHPSHTHILATTVAENINSIRLLEKLGLHFSKEIKVEKDNLLVYAASTDKLAIDQLTKSFLSIFTNTNQPPANLNLIYTLCLPQILIIKKANSNEEVFSLQSFIEPRKKILSDGTLTEFEEKETNEDTRIAGNIAQRFSTYEKSGYLNGSYFKIAGNKFFQFIKTIYGWKISSVIWEDETC